MIFEGEQVFSRSASDLWPHLSDARFLVGCIPAAAVQGQPEAQRAQCSVRPSLTFLRGSMDVSLEVAESVPEKIVRLQVSTKGLGASCDVATTLTFIPGAEGTRVRWLAEVQQLGGLLKALPAGLVRGAAQKVIEDVWSQVKEKLGK